MCVCVFFVDVPGIYRSQPVNTFQWGNDTVISVRFNPGEPAVFAASARYAWMYFKISY